MGIQLNTHKPNMVCPWLDQRQVYIDHLVHLLFTWLVDACLCVLNRLKDRVLFHLRERATRTTRAHERCHQPVSLLLSVPERFRAPSRASISEVPKWPGTIKLGNGKCSTTVHPRAVGCLPRWLSSTYGAERGGLLQAYSYTEKLFTSYQGNILLSRLLSILSLIVFSISKIYMHKSWDKMG